MKVPGVQTGRQEREAFGPHQQCNGRTSATIPMMEGRL